jgi:hypothetical protein
VSLDIDPLYFASAQQYGTVRRNGEMILPKVQAPRSVLKVLHHPYLLRLMRWISLESLCVDPYLPFSLLFLRMFT